MPARTPGLLFGTFLTFCDHHKLTNSLKCIRLGKTCQYPARRKAYGSRTTDKDQSTSPAVSSASSNSNVASPFPDAFFIDAERFRSVPHSTLRSAYPIPEQVSQLLGLDANGVCELYFGSVDTWFPFISKKGLDLSIQSNLPTETPGLALLLLCMKLICSASHPYTSASESTLYKTAKSFLNTIEEVSPVAIHVFQSLVLIALYEVGHGIFPAAYLTVGRAVRLGILRGVHDRKNSTQLFVGPPTWTYVEEERRTWWATSILEWLVHFTHNYPPSMHSPQLTLPALSISILPVFLLPSQSQHAVTYYLRRIRSGSEVR